MAKNVKTWHICALTVCESHIYDATLKNSIMPLNSFKKSEHRPPCLPLKGSSLDTRLSVSQSGAPGMQHLASALPPPQSPALMPPPQPLPFSFSSVLQMQFSGLQRGPSPGPQGPRVSFSPPLTTSY